MENDRAANRDDRLHQLVKAVQQSPKYRYICVDLIRNVGRRELSKRANTKEAVKSTKNKLHQVCGAYFLEKPDYQTWLRELRSAKQLQDEALFEKMCFDIMRCHYSTRERLVILDEFYERIFTLLPRIRSVMDLACGLHPVSIPWMGLDKEVRYYAYDVYQDMTAFLDDFLKLTNVTGYAESRDITQYPPDIKTDVAFLLDMVPCLEQIEHSTTSRLLESIRAPFLIVSFPVHSLGGRKKNMQEHYKKRFNALTKNEDWKTERLEFKAELVYLIEKPMQRALTARDTEA